MFSFLRRFMLPAIYWIGYVIVLLCFFILAPGCLQKAFSQEIQVQLPDVPAPQYDLDPPTINIEQAPIHLPLKATASIIKDLDTGETIYCLLYTSPSPRD